MCVLIYQQLLFIIIFFMKSFLIVNIIRIIELIISKWLKYICDKN